jgi:arylsulfatase A
MYVKLTGLALIIALPGCRGNWQDISTASAKPNVVFIFCDDLGYGDIGSFGAGDINTPHIDQLAENGLKFTSFYSLSPVCSPSRAGLLTGRYPVRTGVTAVLFPESWTGLPGEEYTMAEMFKDNGYVTGIIGKWHLGHHHQYLPLQQGFDEYYGIPYSNDMEGLVWLRGNEVVDFNVDQRMLTRKLTEESLDFIQRHKDKPFFLYLPHVMPHVPLYASDAFEGTSQRGLYGDVVEELDWSVGEITAGLEKLGLLDNTVIVFTSDNGPWISLMEMGGSSGQLRDGKFRTFEGGMRVPAIAMWKNKIKAGTVYEDMASMADWLPTFASLSGAKMPAGLALDGVDIKNVLLENGRRENDEFLYFATDGLQAFRKGDWKVKKAFPGHRGSLYMSKVDPHPNVLFNLKSDPGETTDLSMVHPDILEKMISRMDSAYRALGDLPHPLRFRIAADKSHETILRAKYGATQSN